jgi:hypothetical protein
MSFVLCIRRQISVAKALRDNTWIRAIKGSPTVPANVEFLQLSDLVPDIQLSENGDEITWRLTANARYSAKSAYNCFFIRRTEAAYTRELWSAGAPLLHKLHLWLVLKNRMWTTDRLQK